MEKIPHTLMISITFHICGNFSSTTNARKECECCKRTRSNSLSVFVGVCCCSFLLYYFSIYLYILKWYLYLQDIARVVYYFCTHDFYLRDKLLKTFLFARSKGHSMACCKCEWLRRQNCERKKIDKKNIFGPS